LGAADAALYSMKARTRNSRNLSSQTPEFRLKASGE